MTLTQFFQSRKASYVRLPYIGPIRGKIAKNLRNCINSICTVDVDVRVTFLQENLSSSFNFKDRFESGYSNNVVYKNNFPTVILFMRVRPPESF